MRLDDFFNHTTSAYFLFYFIVQDYKLRSDTLSNLKIYLLFQVILMKSNFFAVLHMLSKLKQAIISFTNSSKI